MKKIRYLIFLKDVLLLALTSFGGPQVHIAMFIDLFVRKRGYLAEDELIELNALCQILPGPTSTQTITALGYRIGGAVLAYLTILVWMTPAVLIMMAAAFGMTYLRNMAITQFIQPIAVAFIFHAGYMVGTKVIKNKLDIALMLLSAGLAYHFQSPWICPIVLLLCGSITAMKYKQQEKQANKASATIKWANFYLFIGVLIFSATLGAATHLLPIKLFENFYRNGSLVFGGGQVLMPILYTEFVEFKHLLNREEFLSGMAIAQVVPGPVFSIAAYVGTLAMRGYGIGGQVAGGIMSSIGIFLPGTFLIFFVYHIWAYLKQYRPIRASLEGINAASTGLTLAAAITMGEPIIAQHDWVGIFTFAIALSMLLWSKIPPYLIVLGGLLLGVVISA